MGEMADFALDDVAEFENARDLYHNGHLSGQEAFEHGFEDSTGCYTGFAGDSSDYVQLNSYESLRDSIEQDINSFGIAGGGGLLVENYTPAYYYMGEAEELDHLHDYLIKKYSARYAKKMIEQIKESGFNLKVSDTKENLSNYCHKLQDEYPKAYEAISYVLYEKYGSTLTGSGCVNKEAVKRAVKENPTCNICNVEMASRTGKFGKFYFCSNRCDGQKNVSDSYWQSFKVKSASLR